MWSSFYLLPADSNFGSLSLLIKLVYQNPFLLLIWYTLAVLAWCMIILYVIIIYMVVPMKFVRRYWPVPGNTGIVYTTFY